VLISGAIAHHFIRILAFREWPCSPLPTGANVIRKFTSSVAGQTYQFAQQFYGDYFLGGGEKKKLRITEEKKDAHRKENCNSKNFSIPCYTEAVTKRKSHFRN